MHAVLDLTLEYPELVKSWHSISNHICILDAKSEEELIKLAQSLLDKVTLPKWFLQYEEGLA